VEDLLELGLIQEDKVYELTQAGEDVFRRHTVSHRLHMVVLGPTPAIE